MDSLIFELQIVFYFQLFLSANVRHSRETNSADFNPKNCRPLQKINSTLGFLGGLLYITGLK